MSLRPPNSTRTDTLFPYATLFRSGLVFAYQGDLAKRSVAGQHFDLLDAGDIARNTTHSHIEFVGLQVFHQIGPRCLHILNLDTQHLGHGLDHVYILALVSLIGLDVKAPVVAGGAYTDSFAIHDAVQATTGLRPGPPHPC